MIARHFVTFALAFALSVAGMTLVPLTPARAQWLPTDGTVLIRYHFVAGQQSTYKLVLKETEGYSSTVLSSGTSNNVAPVNASRAISGTGTIDEQVLIVDPSGVAAVQTRLSNLVFTTAFNGAMLASPPTVADTTQITVIAPDGSVQGSAGPDSLGVSFFPLGLLPRGPITPGAHWTSQVSGALPQVGITFGTSLPTIQLTADNVLTALGQAHGQSVAVIDSAAHVRYKFSIGRGIYAATMRAAGTVTAHTLFVLTAGQPVMTRVHEDLNLSELFSNPAGATRTWTRHFVVDLTQTHV